ncbi:MAG: hypothetical protein U9N34_08580 [Candidatus Cloacimonadota bacterium]|nr:hypothetical protein [Candidatus Cloacimonadota bacterium]
MKRITLLLLMTSWAFISLLAQDTDENQTIQNDVVKLNYEKKSAKTAMLLSAIFPGSGQVYSNQRTISGYIFSGIEIGLWSGLIYYRIQSTNKEEDYMDYADAHYSRAWQNQAASSMINIHENDMYDENHFRLDDENTQHFYEDIGKYHKYIFGWDDWYDKYFAYGVHWAWDSDQEEVNHKWVGNYPTDPEFEGQPDFDPPDNASPHRKTYNDMRQEAEDLYDVSEYFSWGLVTNHILSILDAVRVTRNYNAEYISVNENKTRLFISATNFDNELTPMLSISTKF